MNIMQNYRDAFIYMLFTALSFTFIDKLGNFINPICSLFFMSLYATIWFNLVNYNNLKSLYFICYQNKFIYSLVAATVGVNWLCSIFAPHESDPFIYLATSFIVAAICGLVAKEKNNKLQMLIEYSSIAVLALSIVYMRYHYAIYKNKSTDIGLILGIVSGITFYYYAVFSRKFGQVSNFSSSQILALRFWPSIIALAAFMLINHITFLISWKTTFILLSMSLLSLIIPVFFLQQAIRRIGANNLSIILCITPVLAFLIYSISIWSLNLSNLGICLLITFVLLISRVIQIYLKLPHFEK